MNAVPSPLLNVCRAVFTALVALLSISGCSGVSTSHYFAVADLDAPGGTELTFYRVVVKANSVFTTSQYTAGFFSADALHQLFGEVQKPESPAKSDSPKKSDPLSSNSEGPKKTDSSITKPAGVIPAGTLQLACDVRGNCKVDGGANDRFTVIYGANADAIAEQIRLFADSDNTGKQIAALFAASAGADAFERTTAADQNTEQAKKNAAALAKQLKSFADDISKATSQDDIRRILLRAAQQASQKAGSSAIFDTTDLDKGFTQAEVAYETLSK
jgi:hypothetical protein